MFYLSNYVYHPLTEPVTITMEFGLEIYSSMRNINGSQTDCKHLETNMNSSLSVLKTFYT